MRDKAFGALLRLAGIRIGTPISLRLPVLAGPPRSCSQICREHQQELIIGESEDDVPKD
ncbi:MAG: hypothetical protein AAFY65_17390 [Pseudomonadota bacterium]